MKTIALAAALLALTPAAASASKPVPLRVAVIHAECPDLSAEYTEGCAYPDGRIYLEPGSSAFLAAHEEGHQFDFQRMTDGDRHWFSRMLHIRGGWTDRKREKFADAYANCVLGLNRSTAEGTTRPMYAGAYYNPPVVRHKAICAGLVRIAGRWTGS